MNGIFQSDLLNISTLVVFFLWLFGLDALVKKYYQHQSIQKIEQLIGPFIEIVSAIKDMPRIMWQLALVYLFQWYALFCYWQNSSKSIAQSVFHTSPSENPTMYEEAVSWTGLVNGWYNIVTFLSAFALVWFAKKYSPKLVHFACLILAGIGFLAFPFIENKYLLFPAITGFGIGWASMMGIPYLMVVSNIPKERYGVYMGIVNMMIVIPMILQNITFGYVLKHFLNNDPGKAIALAGVLLLLAAAATLLMKPKQPTGEIVLTAGGGH
ncbi:MFS transporter [Phnomibacter ginsenosidimutans]|uniref:MFS transporter n=1 Tax=Phnomibacter ginsenosidimutans TaxID=2676868 RepID=UPI0018D258A5|nr:MFS transporter [Phnomibacter ginsenosidimutans]